MAKKLLNENQVRRFQELAGMENRVIKEGMVGDAIEGATGAVSNIVGKVTGMSGGRDEEDKGEAHMMSYGRDGEENGDLELDKRDIDVIQDAIEILNRIVDASDEEETPEEETPEEEMPEEEMSEEEMPEEDEEPLMEGLSPAAKRLLSDPKIIRKVAERLAKRLS